MRASGDADASRAGFPHTMRQPWFRAVRDWTEKEREVILKSGRDDERRANDEHRCLFFKLKRSCCVQYLSILSPSLTFFRLGHDKTIYIFHIIILNQKSLARLLQKGNRFCSPSSHSLPPDQGNGALSSPVRPDNGDPNQKAPFLSGGLFGFRAFSQGEGRRS